MVKMKKGSLLLSILFLGVLIIQGCEDDPLLAPQTGSEEDAGSYGNLAPLQDFEEELPRHPTGKLYKRLLKDKYWK